jgi:hypothetical protein
MARKTDSYIVEAELRDVGTLLQLISSIPEKTITCQHYPPKRQNSLYGGLYMRSNKLKVQVVADEDEEGEGEGRVSLVLYLGEEALRGNYVSTAYFETPERDKPIRWFFNFIYLTDDKGKIKEVKIWIVKPESGYRYQIKHGFYVKSALELLFEFVNPTKDILRDIAKVKNVVARSGKEIPFKEWSREIYTEIREV